VSFTKVCLQFFTHLTLSPSWLFPQFERDEPPQFPNRCYQVCVLLEKPSYPLCTQSSLLGTSEGWSTSTSWWMSLISYINWMSWVFCQFPLPICIDRLFSLFTQLGSLEYTTSVKKAYTTFWLSIYWDPVLRTFLICVTGNSPWRLFAWQPSKWWELVDNPTMPEPSLIVISQRPRSLGCKQFMKRTSFTET